MSQGTPNVTYAWSSIRRRLGSDGTWGIFLLVSPAREGFGIPKVLLAVDRAVAVANGVVPARTLEGGLAISLARGVAVTLFWDGHSSAVVRPWLEAFTVELGSAGVSGSLSVSGGGMRPDLRALAVAGEGFPAAFLGYRLQEYENPAVSSQGWLVNTTTTSRVAARAAAWAADLPDAEQWAHLSMGYAGPVLSRAAEFLASASDFTATGVALLARSDNPPSSRNVSFSVRGEGTYSSLDRSVDWSVSLADMTAHLVADAEALDVGLVRLKIGHVRGWMAMPYRSSEPLVQVHDYQRERHLWSRYVIDAHGVNLLTDEHLANAHDLANWRVEKVAPMRYLVSARELGAWFAGSGPDPDTLEAARADFGNMILSAAAIRSNPGPYHSAENND